MTHEEQWMAYNEMLFHRSHEQEHKLRELAQNAAERAEEQAEYRRHQYCRPQRVAVLHEGRTVTLHVDLYPGLSDLPARTLVAEQLLRPQLRRLGWKV